MQAPVPPDRLRAALAADMAVRPRRGDELRLAARVAGKVVLGLFGITALEEVCVEAMLRCPNAGKPPGPLAPGERAIVVGPPFAVLCVEVEGADPSRGTIFVLHGIRDAKESVLAWARMLAACGYRAVLVDLRGHGRSTGELLSYGIQESRDLVQVLDALEKERAIDGPVGVMGHSYGAATAIQWAARDARVGAVVAVASFAGLREVVAGYGGIHLPASLIERALSRVVIRGGFHPDEASPASAIRRTDAAVLLVHGRADRQVPAWHSERIRAARPDGTELVLVDGVGHVEVAGARRTRLAERATRWFGQHLRERRSSVAGAAHHDGR
jgi:pimeloyl-ACP methyl ester carboxylesterase